MTILAKFPLDTFNTSNILNKDFNYYYEMAEEGTTHYDGNNFNIIGKIFGIIFFIIFGIIFFVAIGFSVSNNKLSFGKTGNKISKDVPLFRDIPCKGDIFRAYFIAYTYNLMKKKTDFLGAVLLKWLKENKVKIEKQEVRKNI